MFSQGQKAASLLSTCHALHRAVAGLLLSSTAGNVAASQQLLPLGGAAAAAAGSALQHQRCKHSVKMVLLKDYEKLGRKGDLVKVKAGYARYTLFPQGIADYAVPSVVRNLKLRGMLSDQALLQLQGGATQRSGAARMDPASLPPEQQLPQIIQLVENKQVVVSRRCNRRHPEQPMLGEVTAQHLAACTAHQLKVMLPTELIMMHKSSPIDHFGSFKVPLNLKNEEGNQVELEVVVQKTYRSSRIRSSNQRLFAMQQH